MGRLTKCAGEGRTVLWRGFLLDGVERRIAIPQLQTLPSAHNLGSESGGTVTQPSPLAAAEQINLGTFRSLAQSAAKANDMEYVLEEKSRTVRLTDIKIYVIAAYGPVDGGESHHAIINRHATSWILNAGAAGRQRTYGGLACLLLTSTQRHWRVDLRRFKPQSP